MTPLGYYWVCSITWKASCNILLGFKTPDILSMRGSQKGFLKYMLAFSFIWSYMVDKNQKMNPCYYMINHVIYTNWWRCIHQLLPWNSCRNTCRLMLWYVLTHFVEYINSCRVMHQLLTEKKAFSTVGFW